MIQRSTGTGVGSADTEILADFVRTRDKTLELLSRIPGEFLGRRAEGEEHATGRIFGHIAAAVTWWMNRVMADGGPRIAPDGLTREQIADLLRDSRQRLLDFFSRPGAMDASYTYTLPDGRTSPLTGRWCVLYLIQHEVHHRAKVVLALRQWGFKDIPFMPYSGWG